MKKSFFLLVFLGFSISMMGSPFLIETYQEGSISIPADNVDTVTVVEVTFSLDSTTYVQFATGGVATMSNMWLEIDGDKLPPILRAPSSNTFPNITYTYLLTQGQHTVLFILEGGIGDNRPSTCSDAYLQALIFLPDSASGVAEQPAVETLRPVTNAVISRGPYVSAPGASMVVDATGRVMENVLVDSKVQISSLPAGTYYAKDEERTVVKIVKVD